MDEENTEEQSTTDAGEGNKPKGNTLVDDTNLAAKRLEEATKEAREERLANEETYAKIKLGGTSEAGKPTKVVEESPKEYSERVMKGE